MARLTCRYTDGKLVRENVPDIQSLWQDDSVAFLSGYMRGQELTSQSGARSASRTLSLALDSSRGTLRRTAMCPCIALRSSSCPLEVSSVDDIR